MLNSIFSGKLFSSHFLLLAWVIWVQEETHGYHGVGKKRYGLSLRLPRISGLSHLVSKEWTLASAQVQQVLLCFGVCATCTIVICGSCHVLGPWIPEYSTFQSQTLSLLPPTRSQHLCNMASFLEGMIVPSSYVLKR